MVRVRGASASPGDSGVTEAGSYSATPVWANHPLNPLLGKKGKGGRRSLRSLLLLFALNALALPALAAVEVTAAAEPATVAVGENTTYCIEVLADVPSGKPKPIIQVDTPVLGEGLVSWSARYEAMRWVEGRYQYRCCWTLLADTPGAASIPPVRVAMILSDGRSVVRRTPLVQVTVTPASADQPAREAPLRVDEPRPKPEPAAPGGRWILVLLGGTVVLSSLAAIGWLRNHESAGVADRDTSEQQLLAALGAAADLDGEPFWVALAGALYTYAAAVGGRPGEGLTTAEALALLADARLSVPLQQAVAVALRQADGVRFAREPAEPEEAAARLAELRAALGQTGKDR